MLQDMYFAILGTKVYFTVNHVRRTPDGGKSIILPILTTILHVQTIIVQIVSTILFLDKMFRQWKITMQLLMYGNNWFKMIILNWEKEIGFIPILKRLGSYQWNKLKITGAEGKIRRELDI